MKHLNAFLLAACAGLGLLYVQGDEPAAAARSTFVADDEPAAATRPAVGASPAVNWVANVYPVKAGEFSGTAVAVSGDTLYTAKHVCGRYTSAWIKSDGKWVEAKVAHLPGDLDGAVLTLKSGSFLPALSVRPAKYGERVVLYGLRTKQKQSGRISSSHMVSLMTGEEGVNSGDSGGAVIGSDGSLIGVITGHEGESERLGTPDDRRVVHFVRAELFAKPVSAAAPAKQASPGQQNCPGGVCPSPYTQQQPQQFFFKRR